MVYIDAYSAFIVESVDASHAGVLGVRVSCGCFKGSFEIVGRRFTDSACVEVARFSHFSKGISHMSLPYAITELKPN